MLRDQLLFGASSLWNLHLFQHEQQDDEGADGQVDVVDLEKSSELEGGSVSVLSVLFNRRRIPLHGRKEAESGVEKLKQKPPKFIRSSAPPSTCSTLSSFTSVSPSSLFG